MPYLLSISFVYLPYLQSSLLFAAGTDCGSQHRIQTRSKTRVMQAANAVHGMEDTATSTPKLPQKGISRKRSRAGSSQPLPAPKKAAVSQAEDEEMPDAAPTPTATEADRPCTRAATRRKQLEKDRRQNRAWR